MINLKSSKWKAALLAASSFFGLLLFFGLAVASEGGAHEAAHGGGEMADFLSRCVNFALLLVILFIAIRKTAIKDFFAGRREVIRKRFEDLKRGKEDAEHRSAELEQKLKDFEAEKDEILEQFKADGLAEKERIIAEARERAAQMIAQAELTIQREFQGAKNRLQAELVDIAAQRAQEIIVEEMKAKDQDRLVHEFIERVEKLN
jgi:F-type H+-transporting ATPase subunit b